MGAASSAASSAKWHASSAARRASTAAPCVGMGGLQERQDGQGQVYKDAQVCEEQFVVGERVLGESLAVVEFL